MSKSLNTTAKGDAFEKRVYDIISNLLSQNEFPANCRYSSVYHKHKLYSKKEEQDVIFDIAVETTMPNSNTPSMIYIIECKDYKRFVSVDKVRNFAYQLNEVGAHKGFIFTTSGFQSGAYKIAKENHIGLVKVSEDNTLNWILHRSDFNKRYEVLSDIKSYILEEEQQTKRYHFAAICGDRIYSDIVSLLRSEIGVMNSKKRNVRYLTDNEISNAIYAHTSLTRDLHTTISNDQLLDLVSELGFIYQQSNHISGILGGTDFTNKTISVSKDVIEYSPRWRFTIAHEIGHIVLHSIVICLAGNEKMSYEWWKPFKSKDIEILEHQANLFAISLLMPKEEFTKAYANYYERHPFRRFPYLLLDDQTCNIQLCNQVFNHIAKHFDVSAEFVRNYMSNNKLLTIKSHTHSTYELLR